MARKPTAPASPYAGLFPAVLPVPPRREADGPLASSFTEQLAAVNDPAPFVALLCSGRAGKTEAATLKWHKVRQEKPGQISVFISLTRESAKRIIWQKLKEQNDKYDLGLQFKLADLTIEDALGSKLILLGANREDLVDVLRGFPIVFACFDEAAFFRRGLLERCIEDAIRIRLFDYGGQCWTMSTPGMVPQGYFWRVTTGKEQGWSQHSWNLLANPFLPKTASHLSPAERQIIKERWIAAEMKRSGWTDKHPSYVREFLGQWVADPDSMVYNITEANIIKSMPLSWYQRRQDWVCVLGIDYGVTKATSHVLLAFHEDSPAVYIVRSRRDVGLAPSEAAEITRRWQETERVTRTIGDAGGLGKAFVEEAQRLGVAIEAADKLGKRAHQEYFNDAARSGRLFIVERENEELLTELEQLQFEPFPREDPRWRLREDPRGKKDMADGALYGFMGCWAWLASFITPPDSPVTGGDPNPNDESRDRDDSLRYTH